MTDGKHFWNMVAVETGKRWFTPLFLAISEVLNFNVMCNYFIYGAVFRYQMWQSADQVRRVTSCWDGLTSKLCYFHFILYAYWGDIFWTGYSIILKCNNRLSCLHIAHLIWISDVAARCRRGEMNITHEIQILLERTTCRLWLNPEDWDKKPSDMSENIHQWHGVISQMTRIFIKVSGILLRWFFFSRRLRDPYYLISCGRIYCVPDLMIMMTNVCPVAERH